MKQALPLTLSLLMPLVSYGQPQSIYCPKQAQYIKIGMSTAEVKKACGKPLYSKKSKGVGTIRVPVTQYIYTAAGARKAFYGTWQVATGQGGVPVTVSVTDNKISSISTAGQGSGSFSLCGGNAVNVGDPVYKLTNACGQPSAINNTYVDRPTGQPVNRDIWTYQLDKYQSAVSLTFINDKLQSIGQ